MGESPSLAGNKPPWHFRQPAGAVAIAPQLANSTKLLLRGGVFLLGVWAAPTNQPDSVITLGKGKV